MAENLETPKIIDNVSCRLGDDIAGFLGADACVYVASSGFSLSAFEHLAVGLGKTFTALAVIRYYELRNKNVLVLCPKKLEANWNVYNKPTYKNNPFAAEKLRYDVLCHTDIQRERGESNGLDLSRVNWGGYDLVVIDESHNFRNDKGQYLDRETRYQALLRKVMCEGVKTKVLMLSATPVNNRFNDLKNQLRLAYGGGANEMDRKLGADGRTVEAIFRDAENAFRNWSEDETGPRTAEALFKALPSDFLELLDAVTIARSRKHIERFYNTVANYDIHWNPVRIIQRFGRVDRIGSRNESVQLVNFWPDIALNEYIDLTDRVKNRMQAVNVAGTGYDNPLAEDDDISFRDEPLGRMKGGEIIDMESLKTGVSITDLGLNEYALALKKYMEQHPAMDNLPPGINAVVAANPDEGLVPGVVFFLRNRDEKLRNEANYFRPFYAVYLTMDGAVVKDSTQGKSIIELLRKGCEGRSQPLCELCREFNRETKDGFRMEKYSALLTAAISSIAEKKCESDIDSLFSSTETTALAGDCSNLDAFELMAFFVIKDSERTLRAQDR